LGKIRCERLVRLARRICGVQPSFWEATAFRELGLEFGVALRRLREDGTPPAWVPKKEEVREKEKKVERPELERLD
jgi:hypothetical protein